ncbi:hypothetical protein [Sphaerotilus sp.]|uniref:hypothetical protein n=1 Tax=Sphaerotilus sp. TaxID=2093942 RepID=UPI0034E2B8D0
MTVQARLLMIAPLLSALLSAVLWVLLSGSAARAALPDPTRPPPGMDRSPAPTGLLAQRAATMVAEPAAYMRPPHPVAPVVAPRVQGLQLHADAMPGSATALIDGRLVRVGDRLGDAIVQDIRADGVWLRLPRGGTQWLGLYALVETPEPLTANAPEQTAARKEP